MKCPCEECISYAICRTKVIDTEQAYMKLAPIARSCQILCDYLFSSELTVHDKMKHTRKMFRDGI